MRRLFVATALAGLVSCSFTTAGNFKECQNDVDCGTLSACSQGYCLTLPAGCRREEAGGTVKAFATTDRIPVAALLPLTDTTAGGLDNSEVQGLNAMRLAVSEVNDRNGLKNRSFGLFVCDTQRDPAITDTQTQWMIENLRVPAILSSGTGQAQQLTKHPTRIDAGTLIMSATATGPTLISTFQTEGNVWRVAPPDTKQALVLTSLIKADFPDAGTRVDVIYEQTDYGSGLANPLKDALTAANYNNELHQFDPRYPNTQTTPLNETANHTPAAVVVIAYPPQVRELIGRALSFPGLTRSGGIRWYLADAAKDPDLLRNSDGGVASTLSELDQTLGTAPAQGAGGAFGAFRDSFRTRYGTDPNSFSYTSHSYDAMWLVMLATASAQFNNELTGPRLREGMTKLSASSAPIPVRVDKWTEASNILLQGLSINIEGASGALDFDYDAGVPAAPYEVWQVSDGGIRVLRLTNP